MTESTPLDVAMAMRRKLMQGFWERRLSAKQKAARLWNAAAARTRDDKKIETEKSFSVRDTLETALANRDAHAADVEWWSAVLTHYGDNARSHLVVEGQSEMLALVIAGDTFYFSAREQFPPTTANRAALVDALVDAVVGPQGPPPKK